MDTLEFQHHTFYLGQNPAKNSQKCVCFISPCLHLLPLCFQYCRKTINTKYGEHLSWFTCPSLLCLVPTFLLWFKPFYWPNYYCVFRNVATYECVTGGLAINAYICQMCLAQAQSRTLSSSGALLRQRIATRWAVGGLSGFSFTRVWEIWLCNHGILISYVANWAENAWKVSWNDLPPPSCHINNGKIPSLSCFSGMNVVRTSHWGVGRGINSWWLNEQFQIQSMIFFYQTWDRESHFSSQSRCSSAQHLPYVSIWMSEVAGHKWNRME